MRAPTTTGAGRLIAAQVVGQLCAVAAVPVLTRFFPPAEMGLLQLASALALVLQPLATWGHGLAIPVARSLAEARSQRRRAGGLLATVAACGGVGALIAVAAGARHGAATLGMTALLLLAYGGALIDNAYLVRVRATAALATRNLLTGVFGAVLQVVFVLLVHQVAAAAVGLLLSRAAAVALTRPRAEVDDTGTATGAGRPFTLRRGLHTGASQTVSIGAMQVPTVLLPLVHGVAAAGLVGIAIRMAGAPLALVGQALAQVGQGSIAPAVRSGTASVAARIRGQLRATVPAAALVAAVLALVVAPLAPRILGPSWEAAAPVVAVLAVPCSAQLVVTSLGGALVMLGRETTLLRIQTARLTADAIGIVATVAAPSTGVGILLACGAYALVESTAAVALVIAALRAARAFDAARSPGLGREPVTATSTPASDPAPS